MRRLFLILLVSVLAVPAAAVAGGHASGDGTLVVKNANGMVTVTGRGTIFGHFGKGTLRVVDYNPDDGNDPQVNGAEKTRFLNDTTTWYRGTDVRFLFSGGRYTIVVQGSGIDISAVGKGSAKLLGDPNVLNDGTYAAGGAKPQPLDPFALSTTTFGATP